MAYYSCAGGVELETTTRGPQKVVTACMTLTYSRTTAEIK